MVRSKINVKKINEFLNIFCRPFLTNIVDLAFALNKIKIIKWIIYLFSKNI